MEDTDLCLAPTISSQTVEAKTEKIHSTDCKLDNTLNCGDEGTQSLKCGTYPASVKSQVVDDADKSRLTDDEAKSTSKIDIKAVQSGATDEEVKSGMGDHGIILGAVDEVGKLRVADEVTKLEVVEEVARSKDGDEATKLDVGDKVAKSGMADEGVKLEVANEVAKSCVWAPNNGESISVVLEGNISPLPDLQSAAAKLLTKCEGYESEEESEILETSPCGRWEKRREEVFYRNVPGINAAYLAMDTEECVEVVWNEATFSEAIKLQEQKDNLSDVFEALTGIEHPNIVKFHRYWTDEGKGDGKNKENTKPRVILITEYMSSGSLKQFLKKTKKNMRKITLQSWKKWCIQILTALSHLHGCTPAIVHGNLTCETIFIQHNGLVKIGSVVPDALHKNFRRNVKNLHYHAPEWTEDTVISTCAIDMFAFGMCALETAVIELVTVKGETGVQITKEDVEKNIDSLEDERQKDFIRKCLMDDPNQRPQARDLLFHPVLFEVHSLKLLAAHILVKSPASLNESLTEEAIHKYYGSDKVMASMLTKSGDKVEEKVYRLLDFPVHVKLEKFLEDVKCGIFPLTAFALATPLCSQSKPETPDLLVRHDHDDLGDPETQDGESRRIDIMHCSIQPGTAQGGDKKDIVETGACHRSLAILFKMQDNMNRYLTCPLTPEDCPDVLAGELVRHGFIHPMDRCSVEKMLAAALDKYEEEGPSPPHPDMQACLPLLGQENTRLTTNQG